MNIYDYDYKKNLMQTWNWTRHRGCSPFFSNSIKNKKFITSVAVVASTLKINFIITSNYSMIKSMTLLESPMSKKGIQDHEEWKCWAYKLQLPFNCITFIRIISTKWVYKSINFNWSMIKSFRTTFYSADKKHFTLLIKKSH